MGGDSVKLASNEGGGNVSGKEEDVGKLHQVWRDSGIIVSQTAHGEFTWHLHTPDNGSRQLKGG